MSSDVVRFWEAERGQILSGTIVWVCAPAPSYLQGRVRPLISVLSVEGAVFPILLYPGEVLEGEGQ